MDNGLALMWFEYDIKVIRIRMGDPICDDVAHNIVLSFANIGNIWIGFDFGNPCMSFPSFWFRRAKIDR